MNIYIVIFILYFAVIIAVSVIGAKKVENMGDFTSGGGNMGLLLGVGTSVATWLSVASVMGVPGNIYSRGLCVVTGWFVGWFFATGFMPMIAARVRRPEVPTRTFPEFIHLRYDCKAEKSAIRTFVSLVELVGYFVFSYIQIQGFGIVLHTISGISYNICCILFLVILIFTCMGGFMSVARTDTANAILILIGVIAAAVTVTKVGGGIGAIFENFQLTTAPLREGGEPIKAGILTSPWGTMGASAVISTLVANSVGGVVAPHWIARFMAPKNAKTAALQMFYVLIALFPVFACLLIVGVGGKAIMPSLPEGLSTDYMFPTLIVKFLNPVLGALALAAICAAAVSTANSMLLHCSTSLVYDIFRQFKKRSNNHEEDDKKTTRQLRFWILLLGALACGGAILQLSLLADGFTYIYGAFGAVFFGTTIFGLFTKRMNQATAWASMISGFIAYIYCRLHGAPFGLPTAIFSIGVDCIVAVIVMFLTKKPPVESYEVYMTDSPQQSSIDTVRRIRKDI